MIGVKTDGYTMHDFKGKIPTNVIIIGSGIVALTAAEKLSMKKNVIIITKSAVEAVIHFMLKGGIIK